MLRGGNCCAASPTATSVQITVAIFTGALTKETLSIDGCFPDGQAGVLNLNGDHFYIFSKAAKTTFYFFYLLGTW